MKLTEADEQLIRRFRLDRAAFEREREQEAAKAAAQTTERGGVDGLTAEDEAALRRSPGISRAAFLEERRREQAATAARSQAGGASKPRKGIVLTADNGMLASLLADREARRHASL